VTFRQLSVFVTGCWGGERVLNRACAQWRADAIYLMRPCRYQQDGNAAFVVLAGKEYGTGSKPATGRPRVPICWDQGALRESFERFHRSNLVGMGASPLQFVRRTETWAACSVGRHGRVRISRASDDNLRPGKLGRWTRDAPDERRSQLQGACAGLIRQ